MGISTQLFLLFTLHIVAFPFVASDCEQLPYPKDLLDCFVKQQNKSDDSTPGELISSYCITNFLWISGRPSWEAKRDHKLYKLIQELATDGAEESRRRKRQAEPPLVRKEYRMLTNKERKKFHKALVRMKRDGEYDELAMVHQGSEVLRAGHGGANFLGWHRVYLYLFERALRRKVKTVTLPYWDCTLDFGLDDPKLSVIFSSKFAGNGDGEVTTGIFKDWELTRNIGMAGRLMSKSVMYRILTRTRAFQISEPDASNEFNLEFNHNAIHNWVGGFLSFLNTATRDPIFFLLHCFIDYVWWRFRQQQISNNIDPSTDYPINFGDFRHAPDRPMLGFDLEDTDMYHNIDGYSNHWTRDIYTYQLSPNCTTDCGSSKWLSCVRSTGECLSKAVKRRRSQTTSAANAPLLGASSAAVPQIMRTDTSVDNNVCQAKSPPQNTFEIDGKANSDQWVYMPIKVTNEKAGDVIYNSYLIRNGKPLWDTDIYAATHSRMLDSVLTQQSAPKYEHCTRSGTGALKIYIRVDGLNYDGHSFEQAITDERLPFSSGYAYVPIKNPSPNGTEIMVTAHDECGRLCRPMCRFKGSTDYTPCTGLLRLGANKNEIYASSIPEAMVKVWNFQNSRACPTSSDKFVCLNFLCDAKMIPPWEQDKL